MYLTSALTDWLAEPYKLPTGLPKYKFVAMLLGAWSRAIKIKMGGYDPLTRLAAKYRTDKGLTVYPFHGYTRHYHRLFEKFREREINVLEIGLARTSFRGATRYQCPSLNLWLDYFPRAHVYGFDIDDFTHVSMPRTRVFQGDQSVPKQLLKIMERCADFHIIIDDGSHASRHQQITLETLFPFLAKGGLYIIEDLDQQPARLEAALPCEHKTAELFRQPPLLERLIGGVDEVFLLDSNLAGTTGQIGVISKR